MEEDSFLCLLFTKGATALSLRRKGSVIHKISFLYFVCLKYSTQMPLVLLLRGEELKCALSVCSGDLSPLCRSPKVDQSTCIKGSVKEPAVLLKVKLEFKKLLIMYYHIPLWKHM